MTRRPPRLGALEAGRYDALSWYLRVALIVVAALSAIAVALPSTAGTWCGRAVVVLLVAIPLLRVGWFVVRWIRRRDLRFALVGVGVLVVVAVGAALA